MTSVRVVRHRWYINRLFNTFWISLESSHRSFPDNPPVPIPAQECDVVPEGI
jgi:hypothetical protein